MEVVGDAIALVTSGSSETALQASSSGSADPATRLFAKTGLLVRAGVQSELVVPPAWRGRVSIAWGNTALAEPTDRLVIGPCAGSATWLAYPGGYYLPEPACVELVVRTSAGGRTVQVGIGTPCPGQQPAPSA
jgi:hypothetical protein